MHTADDPRPTHQWSDWQAALTALASARKGPRPRMARPPMWREPGDRPPDLEDFARLRTVLAAHDIVDETLVGLTRLARRNRGLGDLRPARLRLVRALRRHGLIPEAIGVVSTVSTVTIPGRGEVELRTMHCE